MAGHRVGWLLCGGLLPVVAGSAGAQMTAAFEAHGWPVVRWRQTDLTCARDEPAVRVGLAGQGLPERPAPSQVTDTTATYELPGGTLVDRLEPFPGLPNAVARRLTLVNAADAQRDLVGADFRLALVAKPDAAAWEAQSFAMVETAPGGPTLCAAFTSDLDPWQRRLDHDRARLTHHCDTAWRLPPGERAEIGTQYLWVVDGGLAEARRSAQDWYDAVGLTVADGGPDWLRDCVVYQASAGGSVDSMFGDAGGFDAFAQQLDYLADLGCNAFWLMSVATHKVPGDPRHGWNLYGPLNLHEVDPSYGGEAALTRLVTAMRERSFKVLNELVPHGGVDPVGAAHPDWWTYEPDGSHRKGFGLTPDYSSPGYQERLGETARWLVERWGFDGFRIDVADGFGPNWRSPEHPTHPSASTRGGTIGMLRAIREGALTGGCAQPAIVPETGEDRPEYARWGQVGYGFPLINWIEAISPASLPPGELRDKLRDWFEQERGSLPRGMITWRSLNNHDTVVSNGRADRRFGVGLQRALTGVCVVVDGVPMIYNEQEVGSYHHFRALFHARRRVPELRRGAADYLAVQGPPEVFAVLRTLGTSRAVGLVNLSWQPIDGTFKLSEPPPDGTIAYDAVSGGQARFEGGRLSWHLEPYATAVLRLAQPPEGQVLPEGQAPQSTSDVAPSQPLTVRDQTLLVSGLSAVLRAPAVHLTAVDGGTRVEAEGDLTLTVTGVDRWLAESVTGAYEDRLMRRHRPWPPGGWQWEPSLVWGFEPYHLYRGVLPAGRVWQSAVAPLAGGIALAAPSGRGLWLTELVTNAMNVVLTDRSEEPEPGPYGLTLQFLADDPALNPRWVPAYRNTIWEEVPTEPFSHRGEPLRVAFTLRPMDDYAAALAGSRPPEPPRGATQEIGPRPYTTFAGRIWLIEPNTVTWTGLTLRRSGPGTLWIQLRHSEAGPDQTELTPHYQLTLDGRPVSFEWVRLNDWHTGNGYFGWARAEAGDLAAGEHTLSLTTDKTWCAVLPQMYVSRDPAFAP